MPAPECSETVRRDPFLQRLLAYMEAHAEYSSADEFLVPTAG